MMYPVTLASIALLLAFSRYFVPMSWVIKVFVCAWLFEVLILNSFLYDVVGHSEFSTDFFVAANIFAVVGGGYASRSFGARNYLFSAERYSPRQGEIVFFKLMSALGFIGVMLGFYGLEKNFGGFSGISDIRDVALDVEYSKNFYSKVADYASPLSLIALAGIVFRKSNASRFDKYFYLFVLWSYLAYTIFSTGGRIGVVFLVMLYMFMKYINNPSKINIKKTLIVLFWGAAGLVILGGYFMSIRSSGYVFSSLEIMESIHRLKLSSGLNWMADNEIFTALVFSVSYFAAPIYSLDLYLGLDRLPGPLYGAYSFPMAFNFAQIFYDMDYSWAAVRMEVFNPLVSAGYFGNIWCTALRDFFVDFGYFGAIIFSFFLGVIGGVVSHGAARGSVISVIMLAFWALIFLFYPFVNLFYMTQIFSPLVAIIIYMVMDSIFIRRTRWH